MSCADACDHCSTLTTVEEVARLIASRRFSYATEAQLQDSIATLLTGQFQFKREVSLSSFSRIDFLVGDVGIEVKIGRSLSELIHQIDRYCMYDAVQSLIVVVGSVRLARLPAELHCKPVYAVQALRGF